MRLRRTTSVRRLSTLRRIALVMLLCALAFWIGMNAYLGRLSSIPTPFIEEFSDADAIQRLLIIAPHCDDEILAAGGLAIEVIERGGQVGVVIVTNGDGSFSGTIVQFRKLFPSARDYLRAGSARQEETLAALAALGIPDDLVFFLSYPDQGTLRLWEQYWEDSQPFRSPYTKLSQSSYERTYNPRAVYSGHSLLSDLETIIREFGPDTVVAPHPADVHPDHWAAGAFVALAISTVEAPARPRLLLYLAHRADYPVPRGYFPFAPLLPPARLINDSQTWSKVTLSDETVERKGKAISLYKSQLPLLGDFLRSFVRQNELFCELSPQTALRLADGQAVGPDPAHWQTADESPVLPAAEDSARDSTSQQLGAGADFVALYIAQTDSELWVSAQLRGTSQRLLSYSCLVRATNDSEISGIRVLHPPRFGVRPNTDASGEFVLARFRLAELGYPRSVIVSFSVNYPGGKTIDRIGWTIVRIG